MKQNHTEEDIVHTDDDQNTGNHKVPDAMDAKGADRFGGTRSGSENVEQQVVASDAEQSKTDVEPD